MALPENGIYGIVDPADISDPQQAGFSKICLKAKNVTVNEEDLLNGSIQLVVKYKKAHQDPFQSQPVPVDENFTYQIVSEMNGQNSLPNNEYVELAFDLSENPIPLWATDLTLQLVYKGRMGYEENGSFVGEEDGVAVGFLDISEPTPFDIINCKDVVCINGEVVDAGGDAAVSVTTTEGQLVSEIIDVYPDKMVNGIIKFSSWGAVVEATGTNYNVSYPLVSPGHYARVFVLTDNYSKFSAANFKTFWEQTDARDGWFHYPTNSSFYYTGMVNQTYYVNGSNTRYYPEFEDVRGVPVLWGNIHKKTSYPMDSSCDIMTTDISLEGPDLIELSVN